MQPGGRRAGGRLGGFLFLAAGALTLLNTFVAPAPGADVGVLVVTSGLAFAVGVGALVAPWQRWPDRALLVLVPLALALITVGNAASGDDPYSYVVYYVVLFVWLGVAQPRWTSCKLAPLAAAAYVFPFLVDPAAPAVAVTSATVVIPVCLVVGETISSVLAKARAAEMVSAHRAAGMEALAAAETIMQAETDEGTVGEQAARLAVEILHSAGAVVVAAAPGQPPRLLGFEGLEHAAAEALAGALAAGDAIDDACVVALPGTSGVIVGTLVVLFEGGCPDDGFTEPAARLFATKVARSLEQVQVVEALTDAAVRDGLTGVGNRRHADALLASLHPGDAIVLVDLDCFKNVNDMLGHGTGDEVLVAAGHYLRQHLRQSDDVARLGGDEFLVILRQVADAVGAAERLVEGWRGTAPVTTFSAGVDVHLDGRSTAETMRRADSALYNAKRAGRDIAAASTLSPGA